jgi:hypothetical protein
MAVVRGLQGPEDSPVRKTHACAKHYAVHSGLESNRHRFDAQISERDLRETYLPAFKDLVTKAHVQEIMTAYNRFRGEPCAASSYLVDRSSARSGAIREWWFPIVGPSPISLRTAGTAIRPAPWRPLRLPSATALTLSAAVPS